MSIENNLASIAKSLETIAQSLSEKNHEFAMVAASSTSTSIPAAAVPAVQSQSQTPTPSPVPVPMPVPAAPIPASGVPAPFADEKGLMDYVMGKYRTLGPVKGAMIQNCLSEIGVKNIKEVTPDMYSVFFHKVEALG